MNLYVPNAGQPAPPTGSATGSVRNKVALKPGRSLMDWIRFGNSGRDLTGVKGQKLQVTVEELAKHNTEEDAWMAIRGYVYNVTPYMEYHPGGIPELVRGIGQDATELFDEAHKWVNFQSMLRCCMVGRLMQKPVNKNLKEIRKSSRSSLFSQKSLNVNDSTTNSLQLSLPAPSGRPKPRYDWLQTDDSITLTTYTKCPNFTHERLIIDTPKDTELKLTFIIDEFTYCIHLELHKEFSTDYTVTVSPETGKTEVSFNKCTPCDHWPSLGEPRERHDTWVKTSELDVEYRPCELSSIEPVNHDSNLYKISFPAGTRMFVPLGYHVHFRTEIDGVEVRKSYTVVPPGICDVDTDTSAAGRALYFLIKIYKDGVMTQHINSLKIGDLIDVSNPDGNFKVSSITHSTHIVLCAAGTGFTPMAALLRYLFYNEPNQHRKVSMLFYNKTPDDIMWRDQLDMLEKTFTNFSCHHILSRADESWSGLRGRISKSHIEEFVPHPDDNCKPLFCACGPTAFTKEAIRLVKDLGYTDDMVHAFLG